VVTVNASAKSAGRRGGYSTWGALFFLLLFAILIVGISDFYLIPAMSAAKGADHAQRMGLAAYARLLLTIVLLILFAGLVLTFRIGRLFIPRPQSPRVRTKYVDIWAEAGKRMQADEPPETDEKEES
jgi:hypothetical protein